MYESDFDYVEVPKTKTKRRFTPLEDEIIKKYYSNTGDKSFKNIKDFLPNQTAFEASKRFSSSLSPVIRSNIFADHEIQLFIQLYRKKLRVCEIARYFPNRTQRQLRDLCYRLVKSNQITLHPINCNRSRDIKVIFDEDGNVLDVKIISEETINDKEQEYVKQPQFKYSSLKVSPKSILQLYSSDKTKADLTSTKVQESFNILDQLEGDKIYNEEDELILKLHNLVLLVE